jgi:hypothetical protein
VPAPAALAAAGALRRRRRRTPALAGLLAGLATIGLILMVGVLGAVFGLRPLAPSEFGPSAAARADIPAAFLAIYEQAGQRYGIDPWVLAAIGSIETDHGRSGAPGVRAGVNSFGCCAGPMQFNVRNGPPSTWEGFGVDGNADGRRSPYDPEDAIPAAARYLRAAGAPRDYRGALFAYNHAEWYVAEVLAKANAYRGAARAGLLDGPAAASVVDVLGNPRISLTPIQRGDIRAGTIDPRLVSTLAWIGRHHLVVITALQSDHYRGTNHEAGRAMDIGAVDGEICRGTRTGACAQLVRELAALSGPSRSTELIYCWDPDGPTDPRGFARADHCDHIHWGMDG